MNSNDLNTNPSSNEETVHSSSSSSLDKNDDAKKLIRDIKVSVEKHYEENVPHFTKPDTAELKYWKDAPECGQMYDTFVNKHNDKASEKATRCKEACISEVTENLSKKHPNVDSEALNKEVEKVAERQFAQKEYNQLPDRNLLPGQEKWYDQINRERDDAQEAAPHWNSEDEDSLGDEALGEDNFSPESQKVYSPNSNSSPSPSPSPSSNPVNETLSTFNSESNLDVDQKASSSSTNKVEESKRKHSDSNLDENSDAKRIKEKSAIDFIIEKERCEMPDIVDSDGGD